MGHHLLAEITEKISEVQAKTPRKKAKSKKKEALLQARLKQRKDEFFRDSQEVLAKFNRERMILLDLGKAWQTKQLEFEATAQENIQLKEQLRKASELETPPKLEGGMSIEEALANEREKNQVLEDLIETHKTKILQLDEQVDLYAAQVEHLMKLVGSRK